MSISTSSKVDMSCSRNWVSETREKLEESFLHKEQEKKYRAMFNVTSYFTTKRQLTEKDLVGTSLMPLPEDFGRTDYVSVMHTDYQPYNPTIPKPVNKKELLKPETKFRKLIVEGSDPRRDGVNTFYDENMDHLRARSKEGLPPPPFSLHY